MPAGNGTGPQGTGPMTGRGLGTCTEAANEDRIKTAAGPRRYMAYRRGNKNGRKRGSGRNLS
ncbi:MAG: hypothetical protein FH762_00100 [Firmicutes bacterium]|nr:hypothetical protein [Bacillota bacterium]